MSVCNPVLCQRVSEGAGGSGVCVYRVLRLYIASSGILFHAVSVDLQGLSENIIIFPDGYGSTKSSVRDRRGGSKAADAGKLFAEKPDADALGNSGDCASMLPVCRRNPAAFNSGNGHQAEGHKKQHKALNLIFGESRKDGTAFLNRNSEAAIRL